MAGLTITLTPFLWAHPRIERCIIDTTIRLGPLSVSWMNP